MNIPGYRLPMPPPAPPCCGRAPNPLLPGTLQWPLPLLKEWFNSRADALVDMTLERFGETSGFYRLPDGGIPLLDLSDEVRTVLGNKADKATTLAGYGILDAYTKTETGAAISAAISAVKDSAPEAFDTLKEIADWIGDARSGAQAVINQVANKVDKVAGKGLSTNDYTASEKEKLGGVEAGAKDNVVEAASASAFPQTGVTGKIYVAKDENKTYRWGGSQYVQIGGGSSVAIDPTLSVQGAAADAKATGDALAGKRGLDDLGMRGLPNGDPDASYHGKFTVDGADALWTGSDWAAPDALILPAGLLYAYYDLDADTRTEFTLSASGNYEAVIDGHTIIGYVDALAKTSELPTVPIKAVKKNGTPLTPDANGAVNVTVPTQPSDIGAQPAGNYAPATNIPKSALASGVQTSLGLADTAVQPSALAGYATTAQLAQKADASALRYDIGTEIAISSVSSEVVEGETVTYGEATLLDRTANRVAITAAIAELRLTFPAAVSGKVRDFGLRVEVGTGSAALTAPSLVPPAGVTLENADGAIPALADGAADAKGVTLLYFSETAPGVFLVKGEQVKEA